MFLESCAQPLCNVHAFRARPRRKLATTAVAVTCQATAIDVVVRYRAGMSESWTSVRDVDARGRGFRNVCARIIAMSPGMNVAACAQVV